VVKILKITQISPQRKCKEDNISAQKRAKIPAATYLPSVVKISKITQISPRRRCKEDNISAQERAKIPAATMRVKTEIDFKL